MPEIPLFLASTSPRRRQLLHQIGVECTALSVAVDETAKPDEPPTNYVRRLARAKAAAGHAKVVGDARVLAADTAIALDGVVFGKPTDPDNARAMLRQFSGRVHDVLTAVAIMDVDGIRMAVSASKVFFRELNESEIEAYVAAGEGEDKAGGYAIQGRGAVFVNRLEGSYSGVVGLPLCETALLLRR